MTISYKQPTKIATETIPNQNNFTTAFLFVLHISIFIFFICIMVAFVNFLINERWWTLKQKPKFPHWCMLCYEILWVERLQLHQYRPPLCVFCHWKFVRRQRLCHCILTAHLYTTPHQRSRYIHCIDLRWYSGTMGRALDVWSKGRGFKSYSGQTLCKNLRQVVHIYVPLSPSTITWYWPRGGDALWPGR